MNTDMMQLAQCLKVSLGRTRSRSQAASPGTTGIPAAVSGTVWPLPYVLLTSQRQETSSSVLCQRPMAEKVCLLCIPLLPLHPQELILPLGRSRITLLCPA